MTLENLIEEAKKLQPPSAQIASVFVMTYNSNIHEWTEKEIRSIEYENCRVILRI